MWMTSYPGAMVLRIGSWVLTMVWRSWELTLENVGRELGCLPLSRQLKLGSDNDVEKLKSNHGVGSWKTIVEFLPLWHRVGFRLLKDVVSIEWLRKTFKNCLSLLVSKNRSQKLIHGSYLNNRVACLFVYVLLDWYHYGCGTQHL